MPDRAAANQQLRAEIKRLRGLASDVLDALDAEKTPDYGVGHDRAFRAALAMLDKTPKQLEGQMMSLKSYTDHQEDNAITVSPTADGTEEI
jgi:hypothetical protein